MRSLAGKRIVITGGSSGLGAAIAEEILKQEGIPILIARHEQKLEHIHQQFYQSYHVGVPYYVADVSNKAQVETVFKDIIEKYTAIDVLINNAGFGVFRSFIEAPIEEIENMIMVNYLGTVYCTKHVIPFMLKQQFGHIMNIGSQSGKVGTAKSTGYAASKHAVLGFSNSLRHELYPYGIHVTTVNPGPIQTPFFEIADTSGQYKKNIAKYLLDPDKVAHKIIQCIHKPRRELNLPLWMEMGSRLSSLFPAAMDRVSRTFLNKK